MRYAVTILNNTNTDFREFRVNVGIPMEHWLVENAAVRFRFVNRLGVGDFLGVIFNEFADALAFTLEFSENLEPGIHKWSDE